MAPRFLFILGFGVEPMKVHFPFVVLMCSIFLIGCTRTYLSTGAAGVPSPDGDARFCLTVHGAYGRAYTDRTRKLLDVWIGRGPYTNEVTLFSQRYKFVGADLWGDIKWISSNDVVMQVYDYPDGVSRYDAPRTSNHIATLTFQLDQKSGKFFEKK